MCREFGIQPLVLPPYSTHLKQVSESNIKLQKHTGISTNATNLLVFLSPNTALDANKMQKSRIMHATEAGNETWPMEMSELTPKHANKTMRIPMGV